MYQIAIIPSGIDTGRQRNYPIRCRQLGAGIIIPIRRHRIQKRLKIFRFREMIELAIKQLDFSYVPYSGFKVGAALRTKDGQYYTGCNIENASYTPTNCAERTAFFKAVSEGVREFEAICVVGGKDGILTDYASPCGVCRQVMMEFCDPETFQIILATGKEQYEVFTLKEILPLGFGPKNLR